MLLRLVALAARVPEAIVMPDPVVRPLFTALIVPAVISHNVILPLSRFVLPAPSRISMVTLPLPVLILEPAPMVITALPEVRKVSTTPLSLESLAMSVRLPFLVEMLAFMRMLRPAFSARLPLFIPGLLLKMSELTVMSLLAFSITFSPALSRVVISSGVKVLSVPGLDVSFCVMERGTKISTRPVLFRHAGELTTKPPSISPTVRGVIPPEPIWSSFAEPALLLSTVTTPILPLTPFPQVTNPALLAEPLSHRSDVTT